MKKLFITMVITGIISFLFGNYLFKTYKNNLEDMIKSASSIYEKVYMFQYGSYKDKEKAISNNLDNYILEMSDGYYKVYLGATLNSDNAKTIKNKYKDFGIEIFIKEKYISNLEFIDFLYSNDKDVSSLTKDELLSIENIIMNKYKELKLNE